MQKPILFLTAIFIAVTTLNGCFSTSDHGDRSDSQIDLGMAYLQHGELGKARAALNEALAAEPHSSITWGAMAYLEEISGNLTLAAKGYRRAIQLNPKRGEAHNNYGIFLCRHQNPRQGIQELLIATQLPAYTYRAAAFENAALCALRIPDPAAAQIYLSAASRNGLK